MPERRAEALEAMCRRTLAHHDDGTTRRRGHPHMIIVQDVNDLAADHPDLVATIRAETSMFGKLSATTLERLSCDAKFCRVLTDGPSEILDVGRLTRNVPTRDLECARRPRPALHRSRLRPLPRILRGTSHLVLGARRTHQPRNLRLLCWYHHKQLHIAEKKARTRGG